MYKHISDLNQSHSRARRWKRSGEGKKAGKIESKDKNKKEKYKEDKEYERKMRRPKMPIRLEKIQRWF